MYFCCVPCTAFLMLGVFLCPAQCCTVLGTSYSERHIQWTPISGLSSKHRDNSDTYTIIYRYSMLWNTEKYRNKIPVFDFLEYRKYRKNTVTRFERTVFYKIPTVLFSTTASITDCIYSGVIRILVNSTRDPPVLVHASLNVFVGNLPAVEKVTLEICPCYLGTRYTIRY